MVKFGSGFGANMPSSGSLTATLSGLAFASTDLTPTAAVALTNCATTSWKSGTTVRCLTSATGNGMPTATLIVAAVAVQEK